MTLHNLNKKHLAVATLLLFLLQPFWWAFAIALPVADAFLESAQDPAEYWSQNSTELLDGFGSEFPQIWSPSYPLGDLRPGTVLAALSVIIVVLVLGRVGEIQRTAKSLLGALLAALLPFAVGICFVPFEFHRGMTALREAGLTGPEFVGAGFAAALVPAVAGLELVVLAVAAVAYRRMKGHVVSSE